MGIVGEVHSTTAPWKLQVDAYRPLTINEILALTTRNAGDWGWRYVSAADAEDLSVDSETVLQAITKSEVECSSCVHSPKLASRL
jgi:hypothetical protein